MGIFDFLKSKNESSKTSSLEYRNKQHVVKPKINSIYELFMIDLKSSPDSTFVKGNSDTNESGDQITNYRKNLEPKECDLFDTLELKTFEGKPNKNFVFTNFNFNKSEISKVKNLVDQLYLFYGLDSMNNGKFNQIDKNDFREDYWSGRMWTDEKHKNPAMISYDPESGLSLTIWLTE